MSSSPSVLAEILSYSKHTEKPLLSILTRMSAGSPQSSFLLADHLQHLTETLAAAQTQDDVLAVMLAPAMTALHAVAGTILLPHTQTQRLVIAAFQGIQAQTVWQDGPLTQDTPARDVLTSGTPLYFEHADTLKTAYPQLEAVTGGVTAVATAILPLKLNGQCLGVLILDFKEPHTFTPNERRFLQTLAAQCSLALDRAALIERLDGQGAYSQLQARTTELETERAFLNTVLDSLGEAVVTCNAQGQLARFTTQAKELHGQDAQPIPTDQWPSHYHIYLPDLSRAMHASELPLYRAWQGETVRNVELAVWLPGQLPRYVVANAQPLFTPEGLPNGAVIAERDITALYTQTRQLERQTLALEIEKSAMHTFVQFSEAASQIEDVAQLGQLAMETLQAVIPGSSAVLYERVSQHWQPRSWTTDLKPELLAALQQGLPLDTPVFAQILQTRSPIFVDGWNEAEQGLTHTEQFQTVALFPILQEGEVSTVLSVALQTAPRWTPAQQAIIRAVGRSFALLYDRIATATALRHEQQDTEHRVRALEALMQLTMAEDHDPLFLIQQAQELILDLLPAGFAAYYEADEERWRVRSQVGTPGADIMQAAIDAGFPVGHTPSFDTVAQTGEAAFVDAYARDTDVDSERVGHIAAHATLPLMVGGQVRGLFNLPLFETRVWTKTDRTMLITAAQYLGVMVERSEYLAQLAQTNRELHASNQELEAFAYSASHDLRTPVRHVQGFSELAIKALDRDQPEKVRRNLGVVKEATDRMTAMIDAMLILSRVGRQALHLQACPLSDLVAQAQRDAMLEFPDQEVRWEISVLPVITGDAVTLQQALTNLLSNAMKFSQGQKPAHIRIWAEERAGEVAVFVRDQGAGFNMAYADKLFGAFQRLHTQHEFSGTGIGLATVRRIVTRHGGQVWEESTPGQGATFGFALPQ